MLNVFRQFYKIYFKHKRSNYNLLHFVRQSGFTLIELLITVSVFSILSLLAAPMAINYLQGADLDTTSRQILNDIFNYQQSSYTKKGKTYNSSVDLCYGVSFANIATTKKYTLFDGTWNSVSNLCLARNNLVKSVSGRDAFASSVAEVIFLPGSFRPIKLGTVSITGNAVTGTGSPSFTNVLSNGDQVAVSTAPNTCVTVSALTLTTLTTSSGLGNGANQTLIKCVNVTISNASMIYNIILSDEGMLYYKRTQ